MKSFLLKKWFSYNFYVIIVLNVSLKFGFFQQNILLRTFFAQCNNDNLLLKIFESRTILNFYPKAMSYLSHINSASFEWKLKNKNFKEIKSGGFFFVRRISTQNEILI